MCFALFSAIIPAVILFERHLVSGLTAGSMR